MDNLSCTDDPVKEEYSFYEHIDDYLKYERLCNLDRNYSEYNKKCESIGIELDDMKERSNICKRFHCLIDEIKKSRPKSNNTNKYADLAYLRYWLNYELYNKNANIETKAFHKHMKSKDKTNETLSELDTKLDNIIKEELINMNSLFYLSADYIHIIRTTTKT
ncbi:hypothetical protein PCYB_008210 [Plasmodium cynomolgi strain B]|uniref:PIR Superfamily Protein n=1 Tax=Plasmodium cynomolgi (strain B) TaxID=1120755 RepID=K6VKV3_PLACD|nr:hypothetical protein PCYB_008210 [Plasmodium cynomolgi strain B]GAB70072.1 hypothetical protein PCYB_008210 [Plasmodium cynomolgi strain B]